MTARTLERLKEYVRFERSAGGWVLTEKAGEGGVSDAEKMLADD